MAKWLRFQKLVPFPLWESADSNFHTNLYRARKSHNITALSAPEYCHVHFCLPSRESFVSDNLYQTCYFSYPSTLGVFRLFQDVLRILRKCWISLRLLIVKVYRGCQIHERTLFSYFLVWHAPNSIVVSRIVTKWKLN